MQFLNPRTDFAFKKIFGSDHSHDILLSFLNALLVLPSPIESVVILDPYQAPAILGRKNTFVDVRAKDTTGRQFIIEMQVLNVPDIEKRVLLNACKSYANQLAIGQTYAALSSVIALTITDFIMFDDQPDRVHRIKLRNDHGDTYSDDIELVFVELPKFTSTEDELITLADKWLYFLKNAEDLQVVPAVLQSDPQIQHAFDIANRAGLTREEEEEQFQREMYIDTMRRFMAAVEEQESREARSKAEGIEVGKAQGKAQGKAEGKAEGLHQGEKQALLKLLGKRFGTIPPDRLNKIEQADLTHIGAWFDLAIDATSLQQVFGDV